MQPGHKPGQALFYLCLQPEIGWQVFQVFRAERFTECRVRCVHLDPLRAIEVEAADETGQRHPLGSRQRRQLLTDPTLADFRWARAWAPCLR